MEIEYKNIQLEVEYDFFAGEPMIHTYPNGDPGYPGSPAEVIVTEITYTDENGDTADVTEIFNELGLIQDIEEIVLDKHED